MICLLYLMICLDSATFTLRNYITENFSQTVFYLKVLLLPYDSVNCREDTF